MNWVAALLCVSMFLDSRDKSFNMLQIVSGFHLQKFREFRVLIPVT